MHTAEQQDEQLWLLIRQGNEPAYKALYDRYSQLLFATIVKQVKGREDAEDILQDIFLTIWENGERMHVRSSVFAYLYSIMRFKVIRYHQQKALTDKQLAAWQTIVETEDLVGLLQQEDDATHEWLAEMVRNLPPQLKSVYQLHIEAGMRPAEIAAHLGLSQHTVRNYIKEIRKRFKEHAGELSWPLLLVLLFRQ